MKISILFLMGTIITAGATEYALWTDDMPGIATEQPEAVSPNKKGDVMRVTHVSKPTLTFYPAPDSGRPNPVVIVCPGGGYTILAMNLEGTEVAEWLNSIGISAAVLKYRVPNNREGALQDARRAVRLVRKQASEWNIDPERVGMLGFSAGGHLTAAASNSPDRPDFTILIYPAYLSTEGVELVEEIEVDAQTPPAFIVQTQDDKKYYRSSLAYALALDRHAIPAELHLFAKGGHGYGLRPSGHPVSNWPTLCEQWLMERQILNASDAE
jgi:acetyl esterase/lipase